MGERDMNQLLQELFAGYHDEDSLRGLVRRVATYAERGILTCNEGLVVTLEDGSEFQLTIVRSERGERGIETCPGCEERRVMEPTSGVCRRCTEDAYDAAQA